MQNICKSSIFRPSPPPCTRRGKGEVEQPRNTNKRDGNYDTQFILNLRPIAPKFEISMRNSVNSENTYVLIYSRMGRRIAIHNPLFLIILRAN